MASELGLELNLRKYFYKSSSKENYIWSKKGLLNLELYNLDGDRGIEAH